MPYRVLVLDDSALARMTIVKSLSKLRDDLVIVEAKEVNEAVSLRKESQFDVALVDFHMPRRDGLTFVEELRAENPAIAIAMVSANTQKEIVDRADRARAKFLMKPVSDAALAQFFAEFEQERG